MAIAPDDNADYDPRVTTQTSTQASQPTSASRWETDAVRQSPVQSNTPYTPDGIDAQLAELLKSLEVPQPKPLTRTQKIGAGLMRLGQGLAGGDPSMQSGAEQNYARQAQLATETNTATRRGLIGDEVRRREQDKRDTAAQAKQDAQNEAIRLRQEASQAAVDERQRLNDERDANNADHSRAMSLVDSMIKEPGFELPDQETLKTLTHSRAQSIAQAYYQKKGAGAEESNLRTFMTEMEAEAAARGKQVSFNIPIPGKEGGSASLTPIKPEAPIPSERPVDAGTMAHASRVGLKLTGKESMVEANNMIAVQETADRENKFKKPTGRGANTFYGEIVDWMQLESLANAALSYGDDLGGPVQGNAMNIPVQGVKDWWRGTDVLGQRYEYGGKVASVATAKRKLISGAAVTPAESEWLSPIIPSITDLDTKRKKNLRELADGARAAYLGRAQAAGMTDDDLSEIRRRMSGGLAPLPKQPGDIPLGRND